MESNYKKRGVHDGRALPDQGVPRLHDREVPLPGLVHQPDRMQQLAVVLRQLRQPLSVNRVVLLLRRVDQLQIPGVGYYRFIAHGLHQAAHPQGVRSRLHHHASAECLGEAGLQEVRDGLPAVPDGLGLLACLVAAHGEHLDGLLGDVEADVDFAFHAEFAAVHLGSPVG